MTSVGHFLKWVIKYDSYGGWRHNIWVIFYETPAKTTSSQISDSLFFLLLHYQSLKKRIFHKILNFNNFSWKFGEFFKFFFLIFKNFQRIFHDFLISLSFLTKIYKNFEKTHRNFVEIWRKFKNSPNFVGNFRKI